ncbi:MIP/aquaporin family protein [Acidomonas methanolica]|uniref:Glycerol uptake transporter n=1 Tax=Acidomonas methanolica NBRC 104435 TaxID=1231351 RepID=A0A023D7I2_ACIMT|nr:MIP/aquaporin family protein [Acidomonas methanolica]MBU2655149.1 aquaporin family protein [Acidomonas methanolica]TCS25186.1 glycerol uptake facilitator protein [Acidomonas methanolica]GAJ30123.1 glycerol uptake transporter [Acidomonas methanolica NBRC 104435]GBQ52338.1 glycerol uptake transporter [Acidomonas methanolica]GEK99681.1 aquaporin [Acidomonas methanolica NBRC 104435]
MSETKRTIGELISEFAAVAIIIIFGDGAAAMYSLYDPSPYKTAYWGVCIVWGLAVTVAIYCTAAISGTHANPAVTLSLALFREFPWKKVLPYGVAQIAGGCFGALVVYAMFAPVIDHYNLTHHLTRAGDGGSAGVFFTHPGAYITVAHAFLDETILTALLVFGIFAITCRYNTQAPQANSGALIIGLLVAIIGGSAGYLDAWAINPARDFGPRLFCFFAGWGASAIPAPGQYWFVPIVAPLLGGIIGGGAYHYGIRPFMPQYATRLPGESDPVIVTEDARQT